MENEIKIKLYLVIAVIVFAIAFFTLVHFVLKARKRARVEKQRIETLRKEQKQCRRNGLMQFIEKNPVTFAVLLLGFIGVSWYVLKKFRK